MFCGKCGAENVDRIKFCTKCGSDMTTQTPQSRKASSDPLDDIETSLGQEIDTGSFDKGSLFANRYEILDDGKKGGMGAVYKCKDTKLNKIVALKIIHPRLLSSKQALSRFRQEVSISQELQHPNVVKVFNLEEWDDKEYFTMEWVEGVALRDIIIQRKKENKPFTIEEAYRIISQLCDALQYAHQYTVHRDIKPENILVSDEKTLKVKITDFGIAKMLSPSQFTSTSIQMGTPYYMAPEQKLDAANVDKRADIYALGVVLFELLTLSNTIGLELPSEINRDIPKEVDLIMKKVLKEKPEDRYSDAKDLAGALNDIAVEEKRKVEEQVRLKQTEEERKRKEAEEVEKKRKEAERQKATAEEKAKIEAEKKNLAAEKERVEREKKKIEEERAQAEGQRIRQEQAKREEEARQRRFQEEDAQKKKSPMLMIGIVIAVVVGIFIFTQKNKSTETPMTTEALSSVPAPTPSPIPKPAPIPAAASLPAPAPVSAPVPAQAPLKRGLVAYYPFNGNADDESENGNHGRVFGARLTSDRFGNANSAYSFNGVNDHIEVINSRSLNITSDQLTISYWISWQNSTTYCANFGVSKGGYDLHEGYELLIRGSCGSETANGYFQMTIGNTMSSNPLVTNANSYRNTWVHVVGVINNTVGIVYINGQRMTTESLSMPPKDTTRNLFIGTRTPGLPYTGWLNGKIDEIRIYNRALSDAEIKELNRM